MVLFYPSGAGKSKEGFGIKSDAPERKLPLGRG